MEAGKKGRTLVERRKTPLCKDKGQRGGKEEERVHTAPSGLLRCFIIHQEDGSSISLTLKASQRFMTHCQPAQSASQVFHLPIKLNGIIHPDGPLVKAVSALMPCSCGDTPPSLYIGNRVMVTEKKTGVVQ